MAKRIVCDYPIRDDICAVIIDRPIMIEMDGKKYELEICTDHASPIQRLIEKVKPQRAARVPAQRMNGRRRKEATDSEVRAWAMEKGIDVSTSGRVPNAIKEKYASAH